MVLADIVASEAYKKYFLKPLADHQGKVSKDVSPSDNRKTGLFGSGNLKLIPRSMHAAQPFQISPSLQNRQV